MPLSGQTPPNPIRLGGSFAYPALAACGYGLAVSVPGHTAIGNGNPTCDNPGIPVATPQGPPILPAGDSATVGLALDIQLASG